MKIRRYKRAQRLISFYRNNYGFNKPFRIVVDGTFSQAALENKINLREQMPKYLNDQVELVTTACILKELEQLGSSLYGALFICKQFHVEKCPHKPAKCAIDCLCSLARRMNTPNRTKYFIATQDRTLTDKLRLIPGCPILFVKFNSILIDQPSEMSVKSITGRNEQELETVKRLKKETFGEVEEKKRRKRKGPKGPNPLSCKKKKKTIGGFKENTRQHRRRRRKKRNDKDTS